MTTSRRASRLAPGGPDSPATTPAPERGDAPSGSGLDRLRCAVSDGTDPRDVFLSAADVHAYLDLGRTAGYQVTGSPAFQAIACAPGRWRLADLRALLDWQAEQRLAAVDATGTGAESWTGSIEGSSEDVDPVNAALPAGSAQRPAPTAVPRQPGGRSRVTTAGPRPGKGRPRAA